jgi:hypothetical protein
MSNIFQDVLTDAKGVEERLLGPSYNYSNQIKMPSELGMSSKGNLGTLTKDISGITEYVGALVSGKSKATKTPFLGNKFFLKTGAQCKAKDTSEEVDRFVYINNVPLGNIPFISSGMNGVNFSEFRGLIPGVMGKLNDFNPFTLMGAFMTGSTPECQKITLETIDNNNISSSETHYVTTVDIQNMDSCIFPDRKNPLNGKSCKMAFTNPVKNNENYYYINNNNNRDNLYERFFFFLIGIVALYIIFKLSSKKI